MRGLFLHQSKALPRVLGFAMLFLLVRIFINFYQFNRTETLFLEHFNQKIVIQKEGGKAIFRVSETADVDVLKRFIIDSYMASRRVEQYEVEMVTDDFFGGQKG